MVEVICQNCQKPFKTYPTYIRRGFAKFCSKDCYNKSSKNKQNLKQLQISRWEGHTKKQTERVCRICGKLFVVHSSHLKHRPCLCCSEKCRGIASSRYYNGNKHHNWTGGKLECECIVCGKTFYVKPEQKRRTGAKFCSLKCRSFFNVRHSANKTNTDIELLMKKALEETGIAYDHQRIIKKIAVVDFYIAPNLIVQCDGDYWHSLPKQVSKDAEITNRLRKEGYNILRFSGSDIKHNLSQCISTIRESIHT